VKADVFFARLKIFTEAIESSNGKAQFPTGLFGKSRRKVMFRISQLHGYHRRAPRITSDIVVELSEKRSLYVYSGAAA